MAKKNFAAAQAVELYIGNYRFDAIRIVETEEYRMSQGRRKYKIHQMLSHETKERLSPHVTSVLILMKSANSVAELRRLVQRQYGVDQPNLFDGWDVK
ncbi:hypothetical protein [uncultured Nostoc sp.]|uniref:hypothetical protein n=1 Tax=uncultured Nostoc sp. TaxID=340711 RepID=UPI0035CB67D1